MKLKLLTVLLTIGFAHQTFAGCVAPTEPALPNADTAVLAEMVKAAKDVKQFMADGKKYLDCARNDAAHDKMVDHMRKVADNFNAVTTTFKARANTNVAAN